MKIFLANKLVCSLVCLGFITCTPKKNVADEQLTSVLVKYLEQYEQTNHQSYLDTAYIKLNKNKNYTRGITTPQHNRLIMSLLLNLRKYGEARELLDNASWLPDYDKSYMLNLVSFLENKETNELEAKEYLKNNLQRVQDSLNHNPKNLEKYFDYFFTETLLIGKQKTIEKIDSLERSTNFFPEDFAEGLKNGVNEIPDDWLIKKE